MKLLIILLLISTCSFGQPVTPKKYTRINAKYTWGNPFEPIKMDTCFKQIGTIYFDTINTRKPKIYYWDGRKWDLIHHL